MFVLRVASLKQIPRFDNPKPYQLILASWRLFFQDKIMFVMTVLLCGVASIVMRYLSYKQVSKYFGHSCQQLIASTVASKEQLQQASYIRQMLGKACRYMPWKVSCLTQAWVAQFWCQRYRLPYLLFIGISKPPAQPLRCAHAWLTVGTVTLTGENSFETHSVICSYSNVF